MLTYLKRKKQMMKRIFVKKITLFLLIFPLLCFSQELKNYKGELLPIKSCPCIPRHTFTGYYIGGNVGWKWNSYRTIMETNPFIFNSVTEPEEKFAFDTNKGAFIAGIQGGYNYQLNSFLIGVEGDWDTGSLRSGVDVPINSTSLIFIPDDSFSTKNKWQYSVRARLGYVLNHLLLYGTAGFSQLQLQVTANTLDPENFNESIVSETESHRLNGGTIGIGAEYALSKYWSIALEYRYSRYYGKNYDFDEVTVDNTANTSLSAHVSDVHTNLVVAKANLRMFA